MNDIIMYNTDVVSYSDRKRAAYKERVKRYVEAAKSANTIRSYESHFRDFQSYCDDKGYCSLPANPAAVIDYFTFLADIGATMSTLRVKSAAISYAHRAAKVDNPMRLIEVKETLSGIRRTIGTAQKGKMPLVVDGLKTILQYIPDDLRGARDKTILLLGFAGAFRRSELVALRVEDLTFQKSRVVVRVRHSKTDQEGHGMTKVIPVLHNKDLCPVAALHAWLTSAKIMDGAIFRPIDRWGHVRNRTISDQEVARVIKKYSSLAGLDSSSFSGHSLRSGFVTEAAGRDVPIWRIKEQTGHKSDVILQRYIRDQGHGAENAAKAVFGE